MKIGIDFGSSNSIVSVYRNGKPETALLGTNSPVVPSLAARKNAKMMTGAAARNAAGRKGFVVYKGFKMLLPCREEQARERGFTDGFTPAAVAGKFLKDLIMMTCRHYGEEKIDRLVVGAPEIWFNGIKTLSGRNILKKLCQLDCVGAVQIVSEPAAASACFAYNYLQLQGKPFEGHILLIDYGGGTLDLTLSKVSVSGLEDGRQIMEINIEDRKGAGENADGRIGNAGIAYQEGLAEAAIRKAGILSDEEPVLPDNDFYMAVNFLEDELRSRVVEIENTFQDIGTDAADSLEEEEFTTLTYKGAEAEVTYALMVEVYDRLIRPTFQENLEKSIEYMNRAGIDYKNRKSADFKIALVGGFGNFYLVRQQMEDVFGRSHNDMRFTGIIKNREDCENAVSLGTALISAGVISIRHTAPYSVGLFQRYPDGRPRIDYAIHYRQDLSEVTNGEDDGDPGLYYYKKENGDIRRIMITGNAIRNLVINHGPDDRDAVILPLKKEFQEELTGLVKNHWHMAAIAFSMDRSDVLSIHIGEFEMTRNKPGRMQRKELADFDELFDTAEVIRIIDM